MGVEAVMCYELSAFLNGDYVADIVLLLDTDVICEEAVIFYEGFEPIAPEWQFLSSLHYIMITKFEY